MEETGLKGFWNEYGCALERLEEIWRDVGLAETDIKDRQKVFSGHITTFINQIVEEEEEMRKGMLEGVVEKQKELDKLCAELQLAHYRSDVEKLVQRDRDLGEKVAYLLAERAKRCAEMEELMGHDQQLCEQLSAVPFYLPSTPPPPLHQLADLRKHISSLQSQKKERQTTFTTSKTRIVQLLDLLHTSPSSQFECDVVMEEAFVATTQHMHLLHSFVCRLEKRLEENERELVVLGAELDGLWEELGTPIMHRQDFMHQNKCVKQECIVALQEEVCRCKVLRVQNVEREVEALRLQLSCIWDKCFVANEERLCFQAFRQDVSMVGSVEEHRAHVGLMREFFLERRMIIERVNHYNHVWKQFIDFELKARNPDRLFEKGYSLLQEEHDRKRVAKQLTKLENEIEEDVVEWEKRTDKRFRVWGEEFGAWVRARWAEYDGRKENEKQLRQQSKQKQLQQELLYGSTPSKRTFSPSKHSAAKCRRVLQPSTLTNTPHPSQLPLNLHAPHPTSTTFLLSDTIVSSHLLQQQHPDQTIAPIDQYNDFEVMLNEEVRGRTRSSMMPQEE